ncbi:hypothetical protein SeMB42_g02843 [Synchytrium endobioticum]|nr:hypothetical protein SeMB42_g02843 [Synchytrium endobioticum]
MDAQKRKAEHPAEITNLLLQRSGLIPAAHPGTSQAAPVSTNPLASLLGPSSSTSNTHYFGAATSTGMATASAASTTPSFVNPLAMLQQTQALSAAIAQQGYGGALPSATANGPVNPLYAPTGGFSYSSASYGATQQSFYGGTPQSYAQQAPSAAPYPSYAQPTAAAAATATTAFNQFGPPQAYNSINSNGTYSNTTSVLGLSDHNDSRDRRNEGGWRSDNDDRRSSNSITPAAAARNAINPSLLHESERKTICRNWNNNRCELEVNCRFRHVCLRCGSDGHRERQCSFGQDGAPAAPRAATTSHPLSPFERRSICRDYNNHRCPRPNQCKFRHVCLGCGAPEHVEQNCPLAPGGTSTTGSAGHGGGSDRGFGHGGGREREYSGAAPSTAIAATVDNRRDSSSSHSRRNDEMSSGAAVSSPRPTHWESSSAESSPGNERATKRIALSVDAPLAVANTPSTSSNAVPLPFSATHSPSALRIPPSRDPRLAALATAPITGTLPPQEERYKVVSLPPDFFMPMPHTASMRAIKVDSPIIIGRFRGVLVRNQLGHLGIVDYEIEPVVKDDEAKSDDAKDGDAKDGDAKKAEDDDNDKGGDEKGNGVKVEDGEILGTHTTTKQENEDEGMKSPGTSPVLDVNVVLDHENSSDATTAPDQGNSQEAVASDA